LEFNGQEFEADGAESVLDLLLRHDQLISYSCKSGNCQSCLLKSLTGEVIPAAQRGLKSTLVAQGYFLACQQPAKLINHCSHIDEQALFGSARLIEKHFYTQDICRLRLELSCSLYYHAGQFVNLKNANGISRSYSLASLPSEDEFIELHVRHKTGGVMSEWVFNEFSAGDFIDVQGPIGECFYTADNPSKILMLIGTGTGAAPLLGIARDAIHCGYAGDIHFYHGASEVESFYLHDTLSALQQTVSNFSYHPCLSPPDVLSPDSISPDPEPELPSKAYQTGFCNEIALSEMNDAANSCLFICGNPQMVTTTSKKAFLNGVSIKNIYTDPFEYKDMRKKPR